MVINPTGAPWATSLRTSSCTTSRTTRSFPKCHTSATLENMHPTSFDEPHRSTADRHADLTGSDRSSNTGTDEFEISTLHPCRHLVWCVSWHANLPFGRFATITELRRLWKALDVDTALRKRHCRLLLGATTPGAGLSRRRPGSRPLRRRLWGRGRARRWSRRQSRPRGNGARCAGRGTGSVGEQSHVAWVVLHLLSSRSRGAVVRPRW
jgi:hypothetical protein